MKIISVGLAGLFIVLTACNPFNAPKIKEGFAELSRMQIKQVVIHIEFYKLQHGVYPDSLSQLERLDPMVPIVDIAQTMKTNPAQYYYEKKGDKYRLFSAGLDGKAETADDFYPDIEIPDSTRIGLVKSF